MVGRKIMFGENLNTLRCQRNVSQQMLADAIHVTRQTISLWERGGGNPDIQCLSDICEYFGVSTEDMMYEQVRERSVPLLNIKEPKYHPSSEYAIKTFEKKGLHMITYDDLGEFFNGLDYCFECIVVIALELHRSGYIITEIFEQGFIICFKSDEEAICFRKELYNLLISFTGCRGCELRSKVKEISTPIETAKSMIINKALKEIYGAYVEDFSFYWVDELENIRGYANSDEECRQQAERQGCERYFVIHMV